MNRQLYQMGGIGTLPMDFGQPLQVSQPMMNPSFAPMQPMSNPMSNYGQTPLTMAGGGITRLGYQEGGMDQMMMEPQMQEQMMQPQMQEQMMQAPMQGQMMQQAPQIDSSQMDPKQALEIIIQMLIAQGIPPEEAKEIAIQMVQAVAEGGMGEMEDQRIEARFGGMMSNGREQYGIGSFFKSAGKAISGAVKGVTNAVKKVVSSDLGKAALTVAAIYAGGGGFSPQGFSMFGSQAGPGLLGSAGTFDLGSSVVGSSLFGTPTDYYGLSGGSKGLLGDLGITKGFGADLFSGGISSLIPSKSNALSFLTGTTLGGFLGGEPKREDFGSDEEHQAAVARYKEQFQTALNNPTPQFAGGLFPNNPFYPQRAANGGRIGYQGGGIGDLISQVTKEEFFGRPMMAMGGEIPMRKNEAGVTELDYRQSGGFVPPIGIKEKADDIPAMLSNNEFVFTADAVRAAGGGSVNKGAERMYGLMKQLESGIA